jgi:hypothetical protein
MLSAKLATSSPCVRLPLAGTADAVVDVLIFILGILSILVDYDHTSFAVKASIVVVGTVVVEV